jgi:ferredoxin
MEVLSSDLPAKVLVQTEDVLEESSIGAGHFGFGMRSVQLASTAMGLHDVFILQTASSNLYQLRDRLLQGLEYAGPGLFSVFSGSREAASDLPPYLTAAAAMESRAFVAFTYDPSAGPDLASRFSLEDNPQPDLDWPVEHFEYADEDLQRVREQVPFTVVDFVVCDRRYARHFARVPRSGWNENTIPVDEWLALDPGEVGERIPHVVVVDEDDVLHRLIVDAKLMQAARRCREIWHGLQELGGIHNSHAERLLERERAAWEEQKERELQSVRAEAAASGVVVERPEGTAPPVVLGEPLPTGEAPSPEAATAVAEVVEPVVEEAPPPLGDPWIETSRCSTCNECTAINDRMFAYDENKQAYFKDLDAGTYREIVEAAEACQVAVIHPGLPRNPNEPGLEELIERANPFQ